MTYGWAILVVMIVGVVLWQLGVFGGGPGAVNTAVGFAKIKPFEPSIKYTGSTLSFVINNGAGTSISGVNVTASGDCTVASAAATTLTAGATTIVTGTTCGPKAVGDSFSVNINISYSQTVAGQVITHTDRGRINGVAE